jgi:hypothetical protein
MGEGFERDYPLKRLLNTSRQSPYEVSQVHAGPGGGSFRKELSFWCVLLLYVDKPGF